MKQWICRLRGSRFFRWKAAGPLLAFLFPVVLCCLAELGHFQSAGRLFAFIQSRFSVFIFSCLVIAVTFWTFAFLLRQVWISGVITGAVFMVISAVEYHKYTVTGSHLLFSDLVFVKGVADVSKFARLQFNPLIFLLFLVTGLYIFALWLSGWRLKGNFWKRCSASALIGGITAISLLVPAFFAPVCQVFGVDNTITYNAYGDEARFGNNNLITNFAVSINQTVATAVQKPEEYSESVIDSLLSSEDEFPDVRVDAPVRETVMPNVIFIMSESYGDFRRLNTVKNGDEIYGDLDAVCAEGAFGTNIVPTFGNGTVRTEFELMFGLPVKSLNNAGIPHKLLNSGVEQDTFASLYKAAGYSTTYIHPFRSNFYDREDIYQDYDFDQMIFEDDFTVPTHNFRNFIDDDSAFRQAEAILAETKGPDYIHITTMQNHQPFIDGIGEEVDNYFAGIQLSNQALREFTNRLKALDEPTLLVFTGDHFPFFTPECNYYNDMGITMENCSKLYEKTWLVWSNYGLDLSGLPKEKISTFYLPHLAYQLTGLPSTQFVDTILEEMAEEPVYSMAVNPATTSELLDLLTYDRTMGANYSEPGREFMNIDD